LFFEQDIVPLDNLRDDLDWMTQLRYERYEEEPDPKDPAAPFALKKFEQDWLYQFLHSGKVPPGTMTTAAVDGLFSALIAGPAGAPFDDCPKMIWNEHAAADSGPSFDSVEQERYVLALLRRHWTTIGLRLDNAYPHVPLDFAPRDPDFGRDWAEGFFRGMATRKTEWRARLLEDDIGFFVAMMLSLRIGVSKAKLKGISLDRHEEMVKVLPNALVALHHAWRGREDPLAPSSVPAPYRKVGRNERCPCGSGRKYKLCCGSPQKRPLD
jgi:uncharacterized protein